jgi:primosomal protein N' (replication factor Y)
MKGERPNPPERYANIALTRPVARIFTYSVPPSLSGQAKTGARVRVPLGCGKGTAVGFITSLKGEPEIDPARVKPLLGLIDSEPLVDQRMMSFTRWMADYYLCSWGELLAAALPPGGKMPPIPDVTWVRAVPGAPAAEALPATQKARRRVLAYLHGLSGPLAEVDAATLRNVCAVPARVLGEMAQAGLIRLDRRIEDPTAGKEGSTTPGPDAGRPLSLTGEQSAALGEVTAAIDRGGFSSFLLHGVTGSGKTEVYLRSAESVLAAGRSVLYLVPEIALTPILAREINSRFGRLAGLIHSGQTPAQRREQWRLVRDGRIRVVLGVRSALFAPLRDLGLVVVDEEHEATYKAGDSPRFHARDMAVVRAKREGAVVLLGSATPSMESSFNAANGKYRMLKLEHRIHRRPLAAIEVVDMAGEFRRRGKPVLLSEELIGKLERAVSRGEQAMVLLNRRGYAAFLVCRECGAVAGCGNCSVKLTWHRGDDRLRCHHCGHQRPYDGSCEACGGTFLQQMGCGTEQVEEELRLLFPELRVERLDQDTARGARSWHILADFASGATSVLVGTQMIAKGHDFPNVTLVGILNADSSLGLPDFRTAERTFQLLTQAAGRAGRGKKEGQVVIQTFTPDHFSIRCASEQDYPTFYQREIRSRQNIGYPPASSMCCIVVRGRDPLKTGEFAGDLGRLLRRGKPPHGLRILGPVPAPLWKIKSYFRHQIILRSPHRGQLHAFLRQALEQAATLPRYSPAMLQVDVDPYHLL